MACEGYLATATVRQYVRDTVVIGAVLSLVLAACGPSEKEQAAQHLKQGKELYTVGKYEAAIPELEKAAQLDIDAIEPRLLVGNAFRALKRYDEALAAYRDAKKVDRYAPAPHIETALTHLEMGQIDNAVEDLTHVIEIDPNNVTALVLLGKVSLMPRPEGKVGLGRFVNPDPKAGYQRAVLNLSRAIELAPDNVEANQLLAEAYEALGKRDEALKAWTRTKELASNKPEYGAVADEASKALARLAP